MASHCNVDPALLSLKLQHYHIIDDVVLNHDGVIHAWIFGSRALGTYKDSSDIDIAVEGDDISLGVVADLKDRLEQSSLPFKVDLLVKHRISSSELLPHIEKHGIRLK